MISTHDLSTLPPPIELRRLMQSLAALDALISPEWEYRYYSFQAGWGEGEMMGSMRNGSGDELFVLFTCDGAYIKGFDHEHRDEGLSPDHFYASVPACFSAGVEEPAFAPEHVTFVCWRRNEDPAWSAAPIPPSLRDGDGSEWMMACLDGGPARYMEFARDYYEQEFDELAVAAVYRHRPIDAALAAKLNPEADFAALRSDLEEIGYPITEL